MTDGKAKAGFDTKLKQLLMACKRTNAVLTTNKDTAIQRHLDALKALSREVETSRREVEALKIEQSEDDDEVFQWNTQIEGEIEKADDNIKLLENWQDKYKQGKEHIAREEQLKFEIKLHETKLQLQSEHEAAQNTDKGSTKATKEVNVRLPKKTMLGMQEVSPEGSHPTSSWTTTRE